MTPSNPGLYGYAFGKLSGAVYILATGPGDIRSRLRDSFFDLAQAFKLGLPDPLQANLTSVMRDLSKGHDDCTWEAVEATTQAMKNATGVSIAKRIVRIEAELRALLESEDRERISASRTNRAVSRVRVLGVDPKKLRGRE